VIDAVTLIPNNHCIWSPAQDTIDHGKTGSKLVA
jgi:hypothetical protein